MEKNGERESNRQKKREIEYMEKEGYREKNQTAQRPALKLQCCGGF